MVRKAKRNEDICICECEGEERTEISARESLSDDRRFYSPLHQMRLTQFFSAALEHSGDLGSLVLI